MIDCGIEKLSNGYLPEFHSIYIHNVSAILIASCQGYSTGELYTAVIERRLNSCSPNGPNPFEIINVGIPGYTTYQELEFLKISGMDMRPDLVILGFVFNDLYYKYLHRPTKQNLLNSEPATYPYQFNPYAFPGVLFGRSYLAHRVVEESVVIWKRTLQRPIFPFERRGDFYLAWKSYGWVHARKLIGEMQALLKERDSLRSFSISGQ